MTGELLAALSVASAPCVSPLAAAVAAVALRAGGAAGAAAPPAGSGGAHPLALALRAAPGAQAAVLLAVTRALVAPDGCVPVRAAATAAVRLLGSKHLQAL